MTSLPACLRYSLGAACDTNGSGCWTSLMFDNSISTSICGCINMYKITLICSVYESLWIEGSRVQRDLFTQVVLGSENVMFTMDIINAYQSMGINGLFHLIYSYLRQRTQSKQLAPCAMLDQKSSPKVGWLMFFGEGSSRTDAVAVLTPLPCLTPQVCNTTENIVTLGQTQFSWIFTGHVLAVKHLIKPLNPFESYRFILQTAVPYGFI